MIRNLVEGNLFVKRRVRVTTTVLVLNSCRTVFYGAHIGDRYGKTICLGLYKNYHMAEFPLRKLQDEFSDRLIGLKCFVTEAITYGKRLRKTQKVFELTTKPSHDRTRDETH